LNLAKRCDFQLHRFALTLIASTLATTAHADRSQPEDYSFQSAIPKTMQDAVDGLWLYEVSSAVNGKLFPAQSTKRCMSAFDQQRFVDSAFANFHMPLFGGCYGSFQIDTAETTHVVEHCDATVARGRTPALAGFTATLHIERARSPQDRWVIESQQPGVVFRSAFTRIGDCEPGA
jgi:hypothetical protein